MDEFEIKARNMGPFCSQAEYARNLIGCSDTTLWQWFRSEIAPADHPDWILAGGRKMTTTDYAVTWCQKILAKKYPHLLARAKAGVAQGRPRSTA